MPEPHPRSAEIDPAEPVGLLLHDLRARREGLSSREPSRRLVVDGPNVQGRRWPRELLMQFIQPLARLLWIAAALSFAAVSVGLGGAIVAVIVLNALFAFAHGAEHGERPQP